MLLHVDPDHPTRGKTENTGIGFPSDTEAIVCTPLQAAWDNYRLDESRMKVLR